MRNFILLLTLCINTSVKATYFYGFNRQLICSSYIANDTKVLGLGQNWIEVNGQNRLAYQLTIWDTLGQVLKTINLVDLENYDLNGIKFRGRLKSGQISPDRTKVYVLGSQYQANGQVISSIFHVYDIEEDRFSSKIISERDEITGFNFNSKDTSKIAVIYINKENKSEVGFWESEKQLHKIKTYTDPIIPLSVSFGREKTHLLIGFGGVGMTGGVEIFDFNTQKLLKKISVKDHITSIHEWNDTYYFCGTTATYAYNSSSFSFKKKYLFDIESIDYELNLAILKPIHVEDIDKIRMLDLNTGKLSSIIDETSLSGLQFSINKKSILGIVGKSEFDKSEANLNGPSVKIISFDKNDSN